MCHDDNILDDVGGRGTDPGSLDRVDRHARPFQGARRIVVDRQIRCNDPMTMPREFHGDPVPA